MSEQSELAALLKITPKSDVAISQAVGLVIRTAQQAIERLGLTEDDMTAFLRGVGSADALMPLIDPTHWSRGGREEIDEARERAALMRRLMTLPARGDGLLGSIMTAGFGVNGVAFYVVAPEPVEADEPT